MNDAGFHVLSRAPELVERALRNAVREMLRVRRLGASSPTVRDLANIALAHVIAQEPRFRDPVEQYQIFAAVVDASAAFMGSPLGRRLATIPATAISARPPQAPFDADLRDAAGHRHVLRLESSCLPADRLTLVGSLRDSLRPMNAFSIRAPAIHLYSIRDRRLRSYPASQARMSARPILAA